MKTISKCPVCKSDKIVQQVTISLNLDLISGNGSFCDNCGVKFVFDANDVDDVLESHKKSINAALGKGGETQ